MNKADVGNLDSGRDSFGSAEARSGRISVHKPRLVDPPDPKRSIPMCFDSEGQFYQSLVQNLPQKVFCKDREGRFTFVNQPFCDLLQMSSQEILGLTDFDLYPAGLAAKYRKDDQRVFETLQPLEMVEAHQLPNHEQIYVHVLKMPFRNASGGVVGVQGFFWDATERKKTEKELTRESEFLTALLDHVPDMIYFKDAESRYIRCSRSVAARLGVEDAGEVIGKTDLDFLPEERAIQAMQDEEEIVRSGTPILGRTERETWKDGRDVWLLTTKFPFRNKLGIPVGTVGISKEISQLKHTEQDLAQARDIALESTRLKSEFLANMSHELRTPLNAINGMSDFLLETQLTPEQADFAGTIRSSADSLLNLINDILDLSKIEAGKVIIERTAFDLVEVAESTIDLICHSAEARKIELILRVRPEVPRRLFGDPGRLRQILLNLLSNGVKFTEAGEVAVDVSLASAGDSQAVVRFHVRDTGIGINRAVQGRIFQSFTQADGSTTRKYGGTGLGLAICKHLAELMNGHIGLESELGEGSTFWFEVPFAREPARPPEQNGLRALAEQRVLVVCDNTSVQEMLVELLGSKGMKVDTALHVAEAMNLYRESASLHRPYSIALIEHNLPFIDGLSLVQTLKREQTPSSTHLVLFTSPASVSKLASLPDSSIAACLPKPLKQTRVIECLSQLLQRVPRSEVRTSSAPVNNVSIQGPTAAGPLRIFLAEDNPVNRKVALHQLRQLGLTADTAPNGREAVRGLEKQNYDILLLDCQMPIMDGYQVAGTMRERERAGLGGRPYQPLYIIAMTANAMAGDREKCIAAGMDDYLSKPVKTSDLRAAIERGVARLGLNGLPAKAA